MDSTHGHSSHDDSSICFSCESRMREKNERERERKAGSKQRGGEKGKGEEGGRSVDAVWNFQRARPAHSNRAASYGIIIANHDRYLPARIEFDRRKSARGVTWFHPAPVHLLLFSPALPRGCSIFRPVQRGKRKKKTEKKEEEEEKREERRRSDKVNRNKNKKQVASVFPRLRLLHIHESARSGYRLMPKTWNCEFNDPRESPRLSLLMELSA